MTSQTLAIPISASESVSAVLSLPAPDISRRATAVIVAHGAGNDMDHPLLITFCEGLVNVGYTAVRFNFPYKERGRKVPDRQEILELTWQQVFRYVKDQAGYSFDRIIAAGKSMGGRVASQLAARGDLPCDGLLFLGYPLHPAGNKDKLRDEHLYRIRFPMLFFAGTRDTLCDLAMLKIVLGRLGDLAELEVIEGGDHSFKVPKSQAKSIEEVQAQILKRSVQWLGQR